MKILHIGPKIPFPLGDGGNIGIYSHIKCLKLAGFDIDFVGYTRDTNKNQAIEFYKDYCKLYFIDLYPKINVKVAIKSFFTKYPVNVYIYINKQMEDFVTDYLKNNKPDYVFINNIHMTWLVDTIRKYSDAPIILKEENFEAMIMKRFYKRTNNIILKLYSFIQYKKILKFEIEYANKVDNCFCVSEFDAEEIKKYNNNINATSQAVAIEIPDSLEIFEQEKYSLCHIGSLAWEPNYNSLLWFIDNVMPLLIKKFTDVKLYIYGNLANRNIKIPNDLKNNIEIVGFVDDIKKHALSKEVLVVPLQIGSGIRIKILEFLAWGAVIVSTDIGKEGIDIKDSEHLLIANTPQEFVDKISLVFENKINKQEITENAKIFIKNNYSFEAVAKLLNYVIKSVK